MGAIEADKIAKLPKWARDLIEHKNRTIASLEGDIARLRDEIQPTPTYWQIAGNGSKHYVHKWGRVNFEVGEGVRIDAMLEDDKTVYISGTHTLHVTPWASNVIKVRLEERPK